MRRSWWVVLGLVFAGCPKDDPTDDDTDLETDTDGETDSDTDPVVDTSVAPTPSIGEPLCSGDGWCWSLPAFHGLAPYDVQAGPGGLWAVGANGLVLHAGTDGVWGAELLADGDTLRGLWVEAADEVVAVGDGGVFVRFDGTSWTREVVDVGGAAFDLYDVLVVDDEVWAFGRERLSPYVPVWVVRSADGSWQDGSSSFPPCRGRWAWRTGEGEVWVACGERTDRIAHHLEDRWDFPATTLGETGNLVGLTGAGARRLMLTTAGPSFVLFEGGEGFDVSLDVRGEILSASAFAAGQGWAVGPSSTWRFRDGSWSAWPAPPIAVEVMTAQGAAAHALGPAGEVAWRDDGPWEVLAGPPDGMPIALNGVVARGASVAAFGDRVWTRAAGAWVEDATAPSGVTWLSATTVGDEAILVSGEGSAVRVRAWTAQGWGAPSDGLPEPELPGMPVAAFGPDDVWVVADTNAWRWNGETWRVFPYLPGMLSDIAVRGTDEVYAASTDGVLKLEGPSWTVVGAPTDGITRVEVAPDGTLWALGSDGSVFRRLEPSMVWQSAAPTDGVLSELFAVGDDVFGAVDAKARSRVVRWTGTAWEELATALPGPPRGMAETSDGVQWAAASGGVVSRTP